MGQSSSSSRRRDGVRQTYPNPPQPPLNPPQPPLNPPQRPYYPPPFPHRPFYGTPYYNQPPPALSSSYYNAYHPQQSSSVSGPISLFESWVNNAFPSYYRPNQGNAASPLPPAPAQLPGAMFPYPSFFTEASSSATAVAPPPYVEHQKAKTIKNDVNLHKDMIRLEMDAQNPEEHLVSFVYDAVVDGSFTIYYFAKEGPNCTFSPIEESIYKPRSYPFEKATGRRFCQPSGHGIDLGFFDLDSLSKPSVGDAFPLVIYAVTSESSNITHVQITLAIILKNSISGEFQVKVVKQILWIDGERYELQEIFGLVNSVSGPMDGNEEDDDIGKECVICMTEQRTTAVFPCRHLCMCSDCAKSLRLQSNKCPICRQPVEKLMEINVNASSDR